MFPQKHVGKMYLYTEKLEFVNVFSSYKEVAKYLSLGDTEVYNAIDSRARIGKFKNYVIKSQKINLVDKNGKPFSY